MARSCLGNESRQMKTKRAGACFIVGASSLAAALLLAETPSTNPDALLQLTATTANVTGAPDSVRIEILRWSTDDERDRVLQVCARMQRAHSDVMHRHDAASHGGRGGNQTAPGRRACADCEHRGSNHENTDKE